jgi:hypothetical protein
VLPRIRVNRGSWRSFLPGVALHGGEQAGEGRPVGDGEAGQQTVQRRDVVRDRRVHERPDREQPLENNLAHVARLRDGRIAESWLHSRDQYAVDEFWGDPVAVTSPA